MDYTKDNLVDDKTIDNLLDDATPTEDQEIETADEDNQDVKDTGTQDEESDNDQKVEEKQEEAQKEQPKAEDKPKIDWDSEDNPYKKRYSDSSREANIIAQREKGYKERLEKLQSDEVTDDDIKAEYPNINLEYESDTSKILLVEHIRNKRERQKEKLEIERSNAVTTFKNQMDLIKKENPEIAKHEDDFYKFVLEKDPDGTVKDLSIFVSYFNDKVLSKVEKNISKNPTLLKSSGGQNQSSNPTKIDLDQLSKLRKSNPGEYRKLVLSGKIKDEDIEI